MPDPMSLEQIRQHWESAGAQLSAGDRVTPTSRDPYLAQLERRNILDHLAPTLETLEVGCGDCLHGVFYAAQSRSYLGVDVASTLTSMAASRFSEAGLTNWAVRVGSILDIVRVVDGRRFDRVVSQRCLINLPSWELQRTAISELLKVL